MTPTILLGAGGEGYSDNNLDLFYVQCESEKRPQDLQAYEKTTSVVAKYNKLMELNRRLVSERNKTINFQPLKFTCHIKCLSMCCFLTVLGPVSRNSAKYWVTR